MDLEAELRLSYYREITYVNKAHQVKLVQHLETEKIFVLKELKVYDLQVFSYLSENALMGIPKIVELIQQGSSLYVIEEYIPGDSIKELLDLNGPFAEKKAVTIIRQLCQILKPLHAHHPPIIHRDIKPSNLIVKPDGSLVLIDFNSAKEIKGTTGKDTVLIGTTGYAAPEQYGFYESMQTTDIYGIGVLFHELLTGQLPNQGSSCTNNLSPIIKKCTSMDPKQRYQTVAELDNALETTKVKKQNQQDPKKGFRAWLPPGFRSGKPLVMIVGFLWYLIFVSVSLSLENQNVNLIGLWFYRIASLMVFLLETLFIGNYRNIWSRFPLTRNQSIWIKIIGVILMGFILFFVLMILMFSILKVISP